MIEDPELLRRYAEDRAESAFAEIVRRHVDLVYSAALRQVNGDAHLAQDVTQLVFADLARKAHVLARHRVLAGWLFTSTRYAAAKLVRGERRRRVRETEAELMREILHDDGANALDWARVRPVLDAALAELGEADCEAVLLRFFEGRDYAGVGARLGLGENAARMRVERAVEKLRAALDRRGVGSTSAALALALASQAVVAAPAGLAATVTGSALVSGGTAAAQLIFMTMAKSKFTLAVIGLVLMGGAVFLWEQRSHDRQQHALRDETSRLQRQIAALLKEAHENADLRAENTRLREALASAAITKMTGSVVGPGGGAPTDRDGKKDREAWRNLGRATPVGTYETVMWASDRGDLDVLVGAFVLSETQRAEADVIFRRLSDEARSKYMTPERMMALLFASGTPAAWQLLSETSKGAEDVVVRARVWNDRGEANELELPFHRYSEGWRVVIPDWQMHKSLARLKK